MIQAYAENNTAFDKNGDIVLMPEECLVAVAIEGEWSCSLVHPIDEGGRWSFLSEEAVVKLPSYNGDQLFRIRTREKTDYEVTCKLEPIFFDSMNDNFLVDTRPTGKTGQQALNIMITNPKYSGVSDISKISTAYYEYKNLMEALQGDNDNSFLSRWGGELEFDNFTVRAMTRLGEDNGVTVRYGLNMAGIKETVDMTAVITRVYPEGYNGRRHSLYVDSPLISNYPTVKIGSIQYPHIMLAEDASEEALEDPANVICPDQAALNAALAAAVAADFDAGLDKPAVTLEIDMVDLAGTEAYEDYADLETVSLGDTVYAYHSRLGITSVERVVALQYNAILKRVEKITLGVQQYDFFNNISGDVSRLISSSRSLEGIAEIAESAQATANSVRESVTESGAYFNADETETNVQSATLINLNAPTVSINSSPVGTMAFQNASAWNNIKIGSLTFSQTAANSYELSITGTVLYAALVSSTHYVTGISLTASGAMLYFDSQISGGTIQYLYMEA